MTEKEKLDNFNETGGVIYDSKPISAAVHEHESNEYFRQRCKEQITDPIGKNFIKDVSTGYNIVINGAVYIKTMGGTDMQIPFHYMVEILEKELKKLV